MIRKAQIIGTAVVSVEPPEMKDVCDLDVLFAWVHTEAVVSGRLGSRGISVSTPQLRVAEDEMRGGVLEAVEMTAMTEFMPLQSESERSRIIVREYSGFTDGPALPDLGKGPNCKDDLEPPYSTDMYM